MFIYSSDPNGFGPDSQPNRSRLVCRLVFFTSSFLLSDQAPFVATMLSLAHFASAPHIFQMIAGYSVKQSVPFAYNIYPFPHYSNFGRCIVKLISVNAACFFYKRFSVIFPDFKAYLSRPSFIYTDPFCLTRLGTGHEISSVPVWRGFAADYAKAVSLLLTEVIKYSLR